MLRSFVRFLAILCLALTLTSFDRAAWAVEGDPNADVVLTGSVREKDTNAPMANVEVRFVSLIGNGQFKTIFAHSDANGRYQIAVPPSRGNFFITKPPVGYVGSRNSLTLTITRNDTKGPDFLLRHSLTLRGTAQDEAGRPATGASLGVIGSFGDRAQVDAQGNWELTGIDPDYLITKAGVALHDQVMLDVTGEWVFVSNPQVPLVTTPLNIVIKRVPLQVQDVTVRVLTPDGDPVGGAQVRYTLRTGDEPGFYGWKDATANAQGEIVVPKLRPEQSAVLTATKRDYAMVQSGKIGSYKEIAPQEADVHGASLTARDIILAPLDWETQGRVVDDKGQPVAKARVALLWPNDLRDLPDGSVQTDDQGHFTLRHVPHGNIALGAALGHAYGRATGGADDSFTLVLRQPVTNIEAAFLLLERWAEQANKDGKLTEGEGLYRLSHLAILLAPYDPDRALRAMTDGQGQVNSVFLKNAALRVALQNPQRALTWGRTLLPKLAPEERTAFSLQLAALTAQIDPQSAQQTYDQVVNNVNVAEFSAEQAALSAQLAALAGALHNPDSEGWLQALNVCLNQLTAPERAGRANELVKVLARGDLKVAQQWLTQLSPELREQALSALIIWESQHDITVAQQIIDGLANPSPGLSPAFKTARGNIFRKLAATNPDKARAFVATLPQGDPFTQSLMDELQLRTTQGDMAWRNAFEAALKDISVPLERTGTMAELLADNNAALGDELFKELRARLAAFPPPGAPRELAFYYAYYGTRSRPAECYLLLENEWIRTIFEQSQIKRDDDFRLEDIVSVMISLDPLRAGEMLERATQVSQHAAIPLATSLRHQIINRLLLSDEEQRGLAFNFGRTSTDDDF